MLTVSVISPEQVLFEGQASGVVAPVFDGELGILPGPAVLCKSTLSLEGTSPSFRLVDGLLQVMDNVVRAVTATTTELKRFWY
jgi:F-type H+-transporting ATPase subunit epsilon